MKSNSSISDELNALNDEILQYDYKIKELLKKRKELKRLYENKLTELNQSLIKREKYDKITGEVKKYLFSLLRKNVSVRDIMKLTGLARTTIYQYRQSNFVKNKRTGRPGLGEDKIELIKKLYKENLSPSQISEKTGLHLGTVYKYLHILNLR